MSTDSTLTSKGQTTVPKDIRESLGMKSGDRMTFTHAAGWYRAYARQEQKRDEPCRKPAEEGAETRSS